MKNQLINKEKYTIDDLKAILEILRSKDGCPWDQEQTHESIKNCLIEEAYEVVDAIEQKQTENLEEELGDVLLQVVFHAQMGKEKEQFDFEDVITNISKKMIRRHPHVFADENAEDVDAVLVSWEEIKKKEKAEKKQSEHMESIPKAFPALIRSYKIQKKAAEVGFDWEYIGEAFKKVREETEEVEELLGSEDKNKIKGEIGDLLFAVVNVARFLNINPEEALSVTNEKFLKRFTYIEDEAEAKNQKMTEMSLEEMDILWEQAKNIEK